jgi:nitrite reductase/ring-hydroxylating ferredoxin subunit
VTEISAAAPEAQPEAQPEPRARVWKTPPGLALCTLQSLPEPGARNFVLQIGEAVFHGFVVRRGGRVWGYVDRCPHAGFPLAQALDRYLTRDGELILCSWHGALFRPEDGRCVGGPCAGQALAPWPVAARDGMVVTA